MVHYLPWQALSESLNGPTLPKERAVPPDHRGARFGGLGGAFSLGSFALGITARGRVTPQTDD